MTICTQPGPPQTRSMRTVGLLLMLLATRPLCAASTYKALNRPSQQAVAQEYRDAQKSHAAHTPRGAAAQSIPCDVSGFDAVRTLQQELAAAGRLSTRPLVINAGAGHTGTRTISSVLREFGMRVLHWTSGDPKLELMRVLGAVEPEEYSKINFVKLLANYDAVLDMPVVQFFPYILAAFPRARVLHTVRDPRDWAESRARHYLGAPKPFAALQAKLDDIPPPGHRWGQNGHWTEDMWNGSMYPLGLKQHTNPAQTYADAIAYSAQNAYYRCITPPSQYMMVNVFAGDMCVSAFLPQLAAFLNVTSSINLTGIVVKECGAHPGLA